MTLTEFLLARLAEDEAAAKATLDEDGERWTRGVLRYSVRFDSVVMLNESEVVVVEADEHVADHIARHDPARVLADVESKRRIVELARENTQRWEAGETQFLPDDTACVLQLASVFADHPDYQEAWKP